MNALEHVGLRALRLVDPERAHGLALKALRARVQPLPGRITSEQLKTTTAGLHFDNPLGLAAGFDKNAEAVGPLMRTGFGFIELGAATPRAQPGNPKPRLFRLTDDKASINRFGFNNDGAEVIIARLASRPKGIPVGLNLGANKTSDDRAKDYATVLNMARDKVDFATVNVSSPNTEKLRDLQGLDALRALLENVMDIRGDTPVFLKIAPDLQDTEIAGIAQLAEEMDIAAIIATNTTLDRAGLRSKHKDEKGGLSGQPLFEKSTRVLARFARETSLPLIGVGGVGSAEQAYTKIKAGASLVQFYTALAYEGLSLVPRMARGLETLAKADGFATVSAAVGIDKNDPRWS